MKEMKLLKALGNVETKYVDELCEALDAQSEKKNVKSVKRIWIIAAVIAAMVILMGCAVIVATVVAESPLFDYPLLEGEDIGKDEIHLTVSDVTQTSMKVSCTIEGVTPGEEAIYIQVEGPFALEKQTENGWEAMPVLLEDPDWRASEMLTEGQTEWWVDWATVYGVLEPGIYRYQTEVLEGHGDVSVEFTVEATSGVTLGESLTAVMNSEYYLVRYSEWNEWGSMEGLNDDDRAFIQREYSALWVKEYWKNGVDQMLMYYRDGHPTIGMMYRDGAKYRMEHEGDDHSNPVTGWSSWPGMDINRLAEWADMILYDTEDLKIAYSEEGELVSITRETHWDQYLDAFDVEATTFEVWEFVRIEPETAAQAFEEQNKDAVLDFSWEEDRQIMKALDLPISNTEIQPVTSAAEAVERAKNECTVEYDKVLVYRDESAGIWKIEFQILYGFQGYQYVYLDDNGITQMISAAGSRVAQWQDLYPDP